MKNGTFIDGNGRNIGPAVASVATSPGLSGLICGPSIDSYTGLPNWNAGESCHLTGLGALGLTCAVDKKTGQPFCSNKIPSANGGLYVGNLRQLPQVLDYGANISLRRPINNVVSIPAVAQPGAAAPPPANTISAAPADDNNSPLIAAGLIGVGLLLMAMSGHGKHV